jgi:hypothetical protein
MTPPMRLRLPHGSHDREVESVTTALELPASAVELATPAHERATPAHEPAPVTPRAAPASPVRATADDAAYPRTASPGRTARAQYRESEEYEPLGRMLLGLPGRVFLVLAILIAYNAALAWIAVQVWHSAASGNDRLLVIAVIGIGAVVGWAAADMEQAFRTRSRFYS